MRVPAECFYVRFGSFANFLWLQDTLAKWGGDAQNLIALRGLDRGMSRHIEKELVLKQTVLSRMLGDTVIADVAIIGTDTFFREGACYGILFHATQQSRPFDQPDAAAARADQGRRRDGEEGHDRRPVGLLSDLARRIGPLVLRRQAAIFISSPRRRPWPLDSWPRRRARARWAHRRSSATPARSCRSAATTRSGSTPPTPSSATSRRRSTASRWRGGCRRRPTSIWCSLARLAAAGEGKPARHDRATQVGRRSAAGVRPAARRQPHRAQRDRRSRRPPRLARGLHADPRHARRQRHPGGGLRVQQVRRVLSDKLGPDGPDHRRREADRAGRQPRAGRGRRADEPLRAAAFRDVEAAAWPGRRAAIRPDRRQRGDAGSGDELRAAFRRAVRHDAVERRPRAGAARAGRFRRARGDSHTAAAFGRAHRCCRRSVSAGSAICWSATSARPANWGRWRSSTSAFRRPTPPAMPARDSAAGGGSTSGPAPSSPSSAKCSKPSCRSFATRRPPGRRRCG